MNEKNFFIKITIINILFNICLLISYKNIIYLIYLIVNLVIYVNAEIRRIERKIESILKQEE